MGGVMSQEPTREFVEFDLSLHVFTVSATMIGVCLTVTGIVRHLGGGHLKYYGQELIALDAFLFLICCISSYLALKMRRSPRRKGLANFADNLFICALTIMAVICGLIVYEVM